MGGMLTGLVRAALLLAAAGVVAAAVAPPAAYAGPPQTRCGLLSPICHLGSAPLCVCASQSITSCRWVCAAKP